MKFRHLLLTLGCGVLAVGQAFSADFSKFRQIEPQFIAALGAPTAKSGNGAQAWGLWKVDPGPRGVRLRDYPQLKAAGVAPAKWKFDAADWWLEEHGLIMENPTFPLAAGKYLVTGDREVTAVLTVYPKDKDGNQKWELSDEATLYDVTHLGCRSVRYTPAKGGPGCSPANVTMKSSLVTPGTKMPAVSGCEQKEYPVLIVVGVPVVP